jgi:protein-disulfide isomerase
MVGLEKEIVKEEKKVGKFFKNKTNIWMAVSAVLAVVVIVLLILSLTSSMSKAKAADKLVSYLNEKTGGGVTLLGVSSMGSIYEVNVSYQGQEIPVYITKDGNYFLAGAEKITSSASSNTNTDTPTEVEKTDKPSTELFIWSYCPYGVTALTPFAEVAKVLGSSADFKVKLYYDGHGAFETQQNKIQACMQKYDQTKYWDYAIQFVEKVYPKCSATRTEDCDKTESIAIMKTLGIDSTKIMSCVSTEGTALIAQDSTRAQSIGVTGSPSFVIGDTIVQTGRNAEAYKTAVCNAFNSAPSACSGVMSSASATTSGSC